MLLFSFFDNDAYADLHHMNITLQVIIIAAGVLVAFAALLLLGFLLLLLLGRIMDPPRGSVLGRLVNLAAYYDRMNTHIIYKPPDKSKSSEIGNEVGKARRASSTRRTGDWTAASHAAHELAELGEPDVPELLEALMDPSSGHSLDAGIELGKIKSPQSVPALIAACKHDNEAVRQAAVFSLGKIGDRSAVSALIDVLQSDEDVHVRIAACDALGELRDPSAVPALCKALGPDYHKWIYALAGAALSSIGEPSIPCLIESLRNTDLRDDAREAASEALVAIGAPAALALMQLLEDDTAPWFSGPLAASALGRIGEPSAVPALAKALHQGNDDMVEAAAWALAQFDHPTSKAALVAGLRSESPMVRGLVAFSLSGQSDEQFVDELARLLSDDRPIWKNPQMRRVQVAEAAAKALESIGTEQALQALEEWRSNRKT